MRRKQRVQEGKVEAEGNGTYEDEEKDQVDDCDGRGQGAGLDGQADEAREDRIAAQAPFSS